VGANGAPEGTIAAEVAGAATVADEGAATADAVHTWGWGPCIVLSG
jgi:hypothetical protein